MACSGLFTYSKEVSFPGSHGKVVSASGMFVRRIDVLHRLALTLAVEETDFTDVFWIHLRNVAGIGLADL